MKDQFFGCEIEMTGLTRQQAAEAVAALFGATAIHSRSSRTYDPWDVTDNEGKTWRFVFDASIRATHRSGRRQLSTGDDTYKVEMNSPKLEYSEMGKLQDVVRTLRHAGAVVNSSCGMHVHVDASKHTPQSLKNALSIMYSKEDILFKALNVDERRVERWCQKVREPMLEKIRKMPTGMTMEQLKEKCRENRRELTDACPFLRGRAHARSGGFVPSTAFSSSSQRLAHSKTGRSHPAPAAEKQCCTDTGFRSKCTVLPSPADTRRPQSAAIRPGQTYLQRRECSG